MESRRAVLEVFKLLEPKDILKSCGLVSSLWAKTAENRELWSCLGEDFGLNHSEADPKAAYFTAIQGKSSLIYVKSNVLYVYNCKTEALSRSISLSRRITASSLSAFVLLREGSVLVCGGVDDSIEDKTLRVLDSSTHIEPNGSVHPLHSMLSRRHSPAIIEVKATLYLFCGYLTANLSSCEKLSIWPMLGVSSRPWQPLPNAPNARLACNPCAFHGLIYLCGKGGDQHSYERFDTVAEAFTVMDMGCSLWPGVRSSAIHKGDLVIIACKRMVRLRGNGEQNGVYDLEGVFTQSCMNPVLVANRLYSLDQTSGLVYCLDLQERNRVAVKQLPAICRFQHEIYSSEANV